MMSVVVAVVDYLFPLQMVPSLTTTIYRTKFLDVATHLMSTVLPCLSNTLAETNIVCSPSPPGTYQGQAWQPVG